MQVRNLGLLTLVVTILVVLDALYTPLILLGSLIAPVDFQQFLAPIASDLDVAAVILKLITIIVFSCWIYAAGRNLERAGYEDLEYSPASRIWWFAVPFLNFYKPFLAMRELWNVSHGRDSDEGNGLVATWWGLYLLSGLLGGFMGAAAASPGAGITPFVLSSGFDVALAVVAILMLRGIAQAQTQLSEPALEEVFS